MKKIIYSFLVLAIMMNACKKDEKTNTPSANVIVSAIQPKSPKVDEVITITGSGFGSTATDVTLKIGVSAIPITSVNNTEIKFTYPANIPTADLSVTIKENVGKITDPEGAKIISPSSPVVITTTFSSITPAAAKAGEIVTLTGNNFSTVLTANVVRFTGSSPGTLVGATVKTATSTALTVEVPNGAATGVVSIEVNSKASVLTSGFNGVFSLTYGSDGSTVGISGQTTHIGKAYMISMGSMGVDEKGAVYVLSPASRYSVPRLLRISADGIDVKLFMSEDFGYTAVDNIGIIGVTSDQAGAIYTLTASTKLNEYKIWKISQFNSKPELFRTVTNHVQLNNTTVLGNFKINSKGEFYFIVDDTPITIYKVDNTGKTQVYLSSLGADFDGTIKPSPRDIGIDQNDNLYVTTERTEPSFKAIYKFTPAKVKSIVYSSTATTNTFGTFAEASFLNMSSMSVSPDGNLIFIGDVRFGLIGKMDISVNSVTKVAGIKQVIDWTSTGPNKDLNILPFKIFYDSRTQVIYSHANGSSGTGVQRVKL